MLLSKWIEETYFPFKLRIRSELTRKQYQFALNDFRTSINREPELSDLTDANLATMHRWLTDVKEVALITANERVRRLLAAWSWAAKRGIVERWPTLELPTPPRRTPQAWSVEDINKLLKSTERFHGTICGIPTEKWWKAHLVFLFATGCRLTESLSIRWDWLQGNTIHVPAEVRKGQFADSIYFVPDFAVTLLQTIRNPIRDLIFPQDASKSAYYHRWHKLLRWSGVPSGRLKAHRLRVSHATALAAIGEDATKSLGHSSAEITRRSYIDPRFLPFPIIPRVG